MQLALSSCSLLHLPSWAEELGNGFAGTWLTWLPCSQVACFIPALCKWNLSSLHFISVPALFPVQHWFGSPGSGFSLGLDSRCGSRAAERVLPWDWRECPPQKVQPSPFLVHWLGISITSLLQSGSLTSLGESRTRDLTILAASAETRVKTALK